MAVGVAPYGFEVGDALPSPPQGHRRGLTGMQRSRSRARPHQFTHLGKEGIRELVSNPKNWSVVRKVRLSPIIDIDVVEAYYRKHFASSADKPSEKPSDTQSFPLGDHRPTRLSKPKEFPQHSAPTAEVHRLSRMKIVGDRVAIKLKNPQGNPTLSVEETAHVLGRSKPTIYRYLNEGKLVWSETRGRILTASVKSLLKPRKTSHA